MFVDSTIKNGVKNIVSLRKDFFFDSPLMLLYLLHVTQVARGSTDAAGCFSHNLYYTTHRTDRIDLCPSHLQYHVAVLAKTIDSPCAVFLSISAVVWEFCSSKQ